MRGEDAAYAVLGLRPGARPAEVDEAYRRLIKRYHPDMAGGDPGRAAEINRAYTQLRRRGAATSLHPPRGVPVPVPPRTPSRGRRTGWALIGIVAILAGLALENGSSSRGSRRQAHTIQWPAASSPPVTSTPVSPLADFEEPLQTAVIDRAVADAVKLHSEGDSEGAVEYSRACQERLRESPSIAWFDSCVAFDEATVALAGEGPFVASGPFNATAIIARQMGAARAISGDTLAADARLRQIRSRVELTLLPGLDGSSEQQP